MVALDVDASHTKSVGSKQDWFLNCLGGQPLQPQTAQKFNGTIRGRGHKIDVAPHHNNRRPLFPISWIVPTSLYKVTATPPSSSACQHVFAQQYCINSLPIHHICLRSTRRLWVCKAVLLYLLINRLDAQKHALTTMICNEPYMQTKCTPHSSTCTISHRNHVSVTMPPFLPKIWQDIVLKNYWKMSRQAKHVEIT